jgi:uncharacterized protein YndB with AHSA1/START domain
VPSYVTTVDIAAPPAAVWAVTTDVEAWPSWNVATPTVRRQERAPIGPGSTVIVIQPKLRPATWTVREAVRDQSFVWDTTGPGYVVTARHDIRPYRDGSTLRLQVVMTGVLSRVVWLVTGSVVRRYLDLEAAGLRNRCELSPDAGS